MRPSLGRFLSDLTTFGIGGEAKAFVEVKTLEEMQVAIQFAKQNNLPFFVLGKGSNCLFDDQGYDGLVILNKISYLKQEGSIFDVGAGYSFSLLGIKSAKAGYTGLEFASGIPGSVGGAVVMNAGANGQETADVLSTVTAVDVEGVHTYSRPDLDYAYRTSPFQKQACAVVSATFQLTLANGAREKQIDIIDYRKKTQPLQEKSAGCMFRNPKDDSAGRLIESAGCKGLSVGGAQVSSVHANFMINTGCASADDVRALIDLVKKRVYEKSGVQLQEEVIDVSR